MISALGRVRQEDCVEFQSSLDFSVSSEPPWLTEGNPVARKNSQPIKQTNLKSQNKTKQKSKQSTNPNKVNPKETNMYFKGLGTALV